MNNHSIDKLPIERKILFICTGNKYRSPTAEHILKTLAPSLEIKSAGTSENASNNHLIAKKMRRCLIEMGYEQPSIRSQHVSKELLEWADYVFYMAPTHVKYLTEHYPEFAVKYHALYTFDCNNMNLNRIEDPAFIKEHSDVLVIAKLIESCIKRAREILNF